MAIRRLFALLLTAIVAATFAYAWGLLGDVGQSRVGISIALVSYSVMLVSAAFVPVSTSAASRRMRLIFFASLGAMFALLFQRASVGWSFATIAGVVSIGLVWCVIVLGFASAGLQPARQPVHQPRTLESARGGFALWLLAYLGLLVIYFIWLRDEVDSRALDTLAALSGGLGVVWGILGLWWTRPGGPRARPDRSASL